jgi:hypothetical protein
MPAHSKKERKDQRKRDRRRRTVAKVKRRQLRAANDTSDSKSFVDQSDAQFSLDSDLVGENETAANDGSEGCRSDAAENPRIKQWWNDYMTAESGRRLVMVQEKLGEDLHEEWREAIFPESVFEAESDVEPAEYVTLLETLAEHHRDLYRLGLPWFLRSRVSHYLATDQPLRIGQAVTADVADMEATDEPFYGTLSMLRLAGLASAADELAEAGFRRVDEGQLMPWAADEIFHAVMDRHVRNCVEAGATSESIEIMETELENLDANMNPDVAEIRREMVERLAGQSQTDWVRNQLLGTDQKSMRNRYLLSFEFAAWLTLQRPIDSVAADELRGLILESLSREALTMRNYFDGIPQSALDRHLASLLGFMSLDRFKAPATLIAVGHFVDFLADRGLTRPKSLRQSKAAIDALDKQVRRLLQDEWDSCKFLDRLRCS